MKIAIAIILILVIATATGCVHKFASTAEVNGRVIDAATRLPIGGASIYWASKPKVRVVSKEDGSFRLPPAEENYHVILIPGDPVIHAGEFRVEAPGYMRVSSSTRMTIGYQSTQTAEIKMEKEKPNQSSEPMSGLAPGHGSP